MATYHVQSNLLSFEEDDYGPKPLVNSQGHIIIVYVYDSAGGTDLLTVAQSEDGGATWNEVTTSPGSSSVYVLDACIDSQDIIHITYVNPDNSDELVYRTFQGGAFGAEETIHSGAVNDDIDAAIIAVDSIDIPHVVWSQDKPGLSNNQIYYSNRSSGVWAARTLLSQGGSESNSFPNMVLDSNDYIYVFWSSNAGGGPIARYAKFTSFWTSTTTVPTDGGVSEGIFYSVVDALDNVHVVYFDSGTVPDSVRYVRYTEATDSWGNDAIIDETVVGSSGTLAAIGITSDGVLHVTFNDSGTGDDIYYSTSADGGDTWSAAVSIYTVVDNNVKLPIQNTPLYPIVGGVSTQRPSVGYLLNLMEDSNEILRFHTSSGLTLQTPVDKNYSRGDQGSLPASDTNLESLFTTTGYANVLTDDNVYEAQTATDQYAIAQFKNKATNASDQIFVSWTGKSSLAPSTSQVVLQIYNRDTTTWETLDTDSATGADSEFTLTGSKTTNLADYYDSNNWVSCRVYQLAQ